MTLFSQLVIRVQDLDRGERRITMLPNHPPVYERCIAGVWVAEDEWADVAELREPYRQAFA